MDIYSLIKDQYHILSIVGMAKNAGKTVTLNHLIETVDRPLGITSIGRDGERQDIVTKTDKPMVYVRRGTYVATAEMLFHLSEVKMEIVEVTPFDTAMGKIIIGRTLNDGFVQIGGPSSNTAIRQVSDKMIAYGAALVIVDGALDRTSSASPSITEACVLSTGAVLSRSLQKAVEKTVLKINLLRLPYHGSESFHKAFTANEDQCSVVLCEADGTVKPLTQIKTALENGREIAKEIDEKTRCIIFYGALVYQTLLDIIQSTKYYKALQIVISDATKLFIDEKGWQYLKRIGISITVQNPINLIAVTVNPYAPAGYSYDSKLFIEGIKAQVKDLLILDVMEGGACDT